ncbi:MAG: hypothetical protein ACFFD6_06445 [Candidatus Thorarchaeota archaeon]
MPPSVRRIAVVIIVLVSIAVAVNAIIDYRLLGIGYVSNRLCYVSDIQDTNENESYALMFHGVNFTFMYYTLPIYYDENGTGYAVPDAPSTAHFMLTYPDDAVAYLNLSIGGHVIVLSESPLFPKFGDHATVKAGVATAFTPQLHFKWVLLVAV